MSKSSELETLLERELELKNRILELEKELKSLRKEDVSIKEKIRHVKKTNHYVYMVFVDGVPRYVGSGRGDRYKHAVSGVSSVQALNKDFFEGRKIEVVRLKESRLTKEEAIYYEATWIRWLREFVKGIERSKGNRRDVDYSKYIYNKYMPKEVDYWDYDIHEVYEEGERMSVANDNHHTNLNLFDKDC